MKGEGSTLQAASRFTRLLLAIVLGAVPAAESFAQRSAAKPAAADRQWVSQRASEAGAWWMLVQTTCDAAAAGKLLDEMNAAMVAIAHNDLQPLVAERIEDPHLDDRTRAEMERVMQQATDAGRQAHEMLQAKATVDARKGTAAAVVRKEWQVAKPIRSADDLDAAIKDTERALARLCAQGATNVKIALLDPDKGLVGRLR